MSIQTNRLPKSTGLGNQIDRTKAINFEFDGKQYGGFAGDTLASALLANNVKLVARSFKYHRPRGVFAPGSEEPNALMQLNSGGRQDPNNRATTVELYPGLVAKSQNRWPSLKFDIMGINSKFSPMLVAGFYYKTFMWPAKAWLFYEGIIRRAAGLGEAAREADPDHYHKSHTHCDVLVVGAGPAGISAALAAAQAGKQVIIADENSHLGGYVRWQSGAASTWLEEQKKALHADPNITVMTRTTIFGAYDGGTFGGLEKVTDHFPPGSQAHLPRQRYWTIRASKAIYATGAMERPLVFGGNDTPGVMLSSTVRSMLNQYGVLVGKNIVLFTNNDSPYDLAAQLLENGAAVTVVDSRSATPQRNELAATVTSQGGTVKFDSHVTECQGSLEVKGVTIGSSQGTGGKSVACDIVAVSGGWTPTLHLQCHKGGRPVYDDHMVTLIPKNEIDGDTITIGSAAGLWEFEDCITSGEKAINHESAGDLRRNSIGCEALWQVKSPGKKAFVDLQNDVGISDIFLAQREGYRSVEHLKRYTTLGMATDQGKTANLNGLALLAEARQLPIDQVGTTTYRPPYNPVAFGAYAGQSKGHHLSPERLTGIHDWHVENGAKMLTVGQWMRAWYYPESAGDTLRDAYIREATHVREKVGMVDVTTLGKIAVQGPDAAEFLNRLYINGFKTLAPGRSRYGIMLREDGIPFDDGTVGCIAENDYVITTTTANAAAVLLHMEKHAQVIWPELKVHLTSVTDQWATIALAGPHSRAVLEKAIDSGDVSNEGLAFMGILDTTAAGIPARIFRISFSGELAFEINVPTKHAYAAWQHLMNSGAEFDIKPYGTEAMGALRIEKGHIVASELDGRNTLFDLGFHRMASSKKDYVGRYYRDREAFMEEDRPQLVGLMPVDEADSLKIGAQFSENENYEAPCDTLGHVTSVTYSPVLKRNIGLGMVKRGRERHGDIIYAQYPVKGITVKTQIVDPVFYDKKGEKLHD